MEIVFDETTGLLIPGEHKLTIERFEEIFVYNNKRQQIFESFLKLLTIFRAVNCSHVYADGSFVTMKPFPGDIDICWHMEEEKTKRVTQLKKLLKIQPELFFLREKKNRDFIQQEFCADVFPANDTEGNSGILFKDFFQKDKNTGAPKGIIIIDLL